MENLRKLLPEKIGDYKVKAFRDYKEDKVIDMISKNETTTGLPNSNVLYYDLEDDAWVCVRPSGTEPKIKFYIGVKGTSIDDSIEKANKLKEDLKEFAGIK